MQPLAFLATNRYFVPPNQMVPPIGWSGLDLQATFLSKKNARFSLLIMCCSQLLWLTDGPSSAAQSLQGNVTPAVDTHSKLVIQLVGEQWVRQLPEVKFTQRTHTMYVLHVQVLGQIRDIFTVKFMPGKERETRQDRNDCHGFTILLISANSTQQKSQQKSLISTVLYIKA